VPRLGLQRATLRRKGLRVRIAFVVWTRFDRHSELLARQLGAEMHFIYCGQQGSVLQAPLRYALQALRTWQTLSRDRPDVVFVQNPPIFAVLVTLVYSRCYGARYFISSHSAAFLSPKWRWSIGLQRALSRRAAATIVHNRYQERIIAAWGCPHCVLGFIPGSYPPGEHTTLPAQFNAAVISSAAEDEPLSVVFKAAASLPEVDFYVTGDSTRLSSQLLANKPGNCRLTGFLSYDRYIGLLRAVDVIVDLTTRDDTLLCGAIEAVSIGKPLVLSDWPILRECFPLGAVHVQNSVEDLLRGIRESQRDHAALQRDILRLHEQLCAEWDRKLGELQRILGAG